MSPRIFYLAHIAHIHCAVGRGLSSIVIIDYEVTWWDHVLTDIKGEDSSAEKYYMYGNFVANCSFQIMAKSQLVVKIQSCW